MSLLAPLALLGLLIIPLIILLHLLRTRRVPMLISNLKLWQGLQQKKQSVRPRYIPLTLLLLLQLCIASGLVLALARPAFSFLVRQPQHTTFILDTTTSMAAQDNAVRFDVARQTVQTHLQQMGDNDTFAIVTLNRRPQLLSSGNIQQTARALADLESLTPGGTGLDLSAALTLANGLVNPDRKNEIIVLTDGVYNINPDALPSMQVPVTWQLIPNQPANNQALLNVSAQTWPDGRHRLFARIINYGNAPVQRTLRIIVNGKPAQEISVDLGPNAESARAWTLPAPAQTVAVEIVEPDVLPLDNKAELFITTPHQYDVLLASVAPEPEASVLARALEAQGVQVAAIAPDDVDRYSLQDFDLIVFDGWLPQRWPEGGVLVVNPPLDHPLLPADEMHANVRPNSDTTSNFLSGVDWSGVYFGQASNLALPNWAKLDLFGTPVSDDTTAASQNIPLVFHGVTDKSYVVAWAFNVDESNLAGRLALPLLTANTLSLLLSALPPAVTPLGEPVSLGQNLTVETPDGRRMMLPPGTENGLSNFSRTQEPGLYQIYNSDNRLVGGFGVHAGSALESNLTAQFQPEAVAGVNPESVVAPEPLYFELWPWLAGLAVLVVAVEGWLAWRK